MLLLFALVACSGGADSSPAQFSAQASNATPAPSPTPETPRVIAVFGADDSPAFLSGIEQAATDSGIMIEPVDGGIAALAAYEAKDDTVAIVYLSSEEQQLPQVDFPVYAFAASGQSVSTIPYLGYDASSAPKLALESALAYPPHLAPVRLIGLFTSETSPVYMLWSEQKASGLIFAKEEYFAATCEIPLTDWLNETLARYFPGMLDAVFAETGELAIAAADVLASLERDDIEVFSAGSDADVLQKLSPILVYAAGADQKHAGEMCFSKAVKLFSGEQAQSNILLPESFWYEDKK